jgi:hypothetical protein
MTVEEKDIVKIEPDSEMRRRARYTATKKVEFTADTWQDRESLRRYSDLFMGDLAALCVEKYLTFHEIKCVNYDVYRVTSGIDPDFKKPAKWDLGVCDNLFIEVKSSLEKTIPSNQLDQIIQSRRIIAYPRREIDIHVQVFYIPEDLSLAESLEENLDELSKEEVDNCLENLNVAYMMGWATREDLRAAQTSEIIGKTLVERYRRYRDFFIQDSKPMIELVKHIIKICGC